MTAVLRSVTDDDWPHIVALETQTYAASGLSEDPALLATRFDPTTSFVLATEDGIAGYLLALPYPPFRCPDPAHAEQTIFVSSNLHLHDVVIRPGYRRKGWGGRLTHHLLTAARQHAYDTVSLVSVGDSAAFWVAQSFHTHREVKLPAAYGSGAAYMSRPLTAKT